MKITYYGHSCFRLEACSGTSVITDPYVRVGYSLPPNVSADGATVSHNHFDHNYTDGIQAERIISTVGVHNIKDISVRGIPSWHDEKCGALRGENVIFVLNIDGLKVCHLGDLGEPCNAKLIEQIGAVDVLLIPVGGTYTIDAKQAYEYVQALAPKTVIPMHYRPDDGTLDITDCNPFLALFPQEKSVLVKDGKTAIEKSSRGEMEIVYMERMKNE